MLKTVLAATTALALAGSSFALAQQANDGSAGADMQRHWRQSAGDAAAFTDARIAAIKAGLKLTGDQEKNWAPFEQAYRDFAKMRAEHRRARWERREGAQRTNDLNPIDRLERRADAVTARGTALKHLADAAGPLYQSLDDGQKHRFLLLSRSVGGRHHERFAFWRMRRGGQEGER